MNFVRRYIIFSFVNSFLLHLFPSALSFSSRDVGLLHGLEENKIQKKKSFAKILRTQKASSFSFCSFVFFS